MSYAVGSLVRARGREWMVHPDSQYDFLVLRPLGGSDLEIAGLHTALEDVSPASFDLPNTDEPGDHASCRLLRDAVRLGFRTSAGPFRSFARMAVEPRPYQLVPLLMALRQDPVRLLIADDVGIGKTVEAGMIARELIDRGEIKRMAVLCSPQLAEQWQRELREKFHIDTELVLPGTATVLERCCRIGQSLFDYYPFVVVSTDFIKSDKRREEFFRTCPEFVIVDEAHTCAYAGEGKGIRHQRYKLVKGLSDDKSRHMLLVTATPHSGNEDAFRSLLTLLKPEFKSLPDDLTGDDHEGERKVLAQHFIQRKRGDIKSYLGSETVFPDRTDLESDYRLSPEYKNLFDKALKYARESITDASTGVVRQRVRWWSALALLRSLASSPAAAASTLRNRAQGLEEQSANDVDEAGRRAVLDIMEGDTIDATDITPGCDVTLETDSPERRRLLQMARDAEAITPEKDNKLKKTVEIIKELVKDGFNPIVFCRFIPTAEYVKSELRLKLPSGVTVEAVTGLLPPEDRKERIETLSKEPKRVLVCTDCLSEGINLQDGFDAVFHYDLAWNPTRHEQREGRVDRYGQQRPMIKVVTYYGADNQIDGIVLNVLIRKHKTIRSALGISVPVPIDTDHVINAIFEGVLLKGGDISGQALSQIGLYDHIRPQKDELYKEWDAVVDREKRSRTLFAQQTIKIDEVQEELQSVRQSIGSSANVRDFCASAFSALGGVVTGDGALEIDLTDKSIPQALLDAIPMGGKFRARFELPIAQNEVLLSRTHPVTEGLAGYVMETAFDSQFDCVQNRCPARRCGVIRTKAVSKRTTVILARFRHNIVTTDKEGERTMLAEDCQLVGFAGAPETAEWLDGADLEALLSCKPDQNTAKEQATHFLNTILEGYSYIAPHLEELAFAKAKEFLGAHQRVRRATLMKGVKHRVEPVLPPDVLGVYVYLPVQQTSGVQS